MRKEDRRMRTYWACEFRENPDVVPLVRDLHRESAPGSGERAFWTLLLHRHREWCREVLEALRTWACEDPEPFSGDPDYYELQDALEGRGKVRGGWKALLHLFVEIPPDKVGTWAREGALRLWGTLEPREPHKAAGNLVGILDRLGERAAIERVIDPTGPDPESESCDSPCSQAFHWWLGHASPAALHEALVTGDWRANGIATTLARRGVSEGIDWLCRSLSSRQEWTRVRSSLDLLVQKAPDRLFAEVDSLFRGFPEHGHSLLAWLAWLAKPPAGPVAREARLFLRRHHLQGEK
jgi:hypothetical protein